MPKGWKKGKMEQKFAKAGVATKPLRINAAYAAAAHTFNINKRD